MLAGAREFWIDFTRLQMFSRIGGDQAPCLRNFVDVKSDFLSGGTLP
jgi:hypothetical protein